MENPSMLGSKWSPEEETQLLEELNKNIEMKTIAQIHNRTMGGIQSRRKLIAYKLYVKNVSVEEIIEKTKLDRKIIQKSIHKHKPVNEIVELKNEIHDLKIKIQELMDKVN